MYCFFSIFFFFFFSFSVFFCFFFVFFFLVGEEEGERNLKFVTTEEQQNSNIITIGLDYHNTSLASISIFCEQPSRKYQGIQIGHFHKSHFHFNAFTLLHSERPKL